jgi:hypothetical protein
MYTCIILRIQLRKMHKNLLKLQIFSGCCILILPFFYRESLLKSERWDDGIVDLIYNGLSDAYETLYPVLDDPGNEGMMRLLKKSQIGNLTVSTFFHCLFLK